MKGIECKFNVLRFFSIGLKFFKTKKLVGKQHNKIHVLGCYKSNCGFRPCILNHKYAQTSLLIKIGSITINTFLPMRNKFADSCSIKIHALGFNELLESIFCLLLVVEMVSVQKVIEMLEEVIVIWQEVRWIWQMRQNFIAQFVQLWKHWLCYVLLSIVMEKNRALSVNQC